MKPKQVDQQKCKGYAFPPNKKAFVAKDVILYALGVGASQNPVDEQDLEFTYELADRFQVLPSFATVIPSIQSMFEGLQSCPGFPDFEPMMLLHGEEKIKLIKPLPTEAVVSCQHVIFDVFDKGSGCLVIMHSSCKDANDVEFCLVETSLFIRGLGGFGGSRGPPSRPVTIPDVPPTSVYKLKTQPNQALLYRLSGDVNPLHVDPQLAAVGGFERPILHGLCTFGIATHGLVKTICENDASRVAEIEGRFSERVIPGDELEVQFWRESETRVLFRVINVSNGGNLALTNGVAFLRIQSAL